MTTPEERSFHERYGSEEWEMADERRAVIAIWLVLGGVTAVVVALVVALVVAAWS